MKRGICTKVMCTDISFRFMYLEEFLWMIYRKLRKIIELRDWQPPAVCDNICVGTFINFENR